MEICCGGCHVELEKDDVVILDFMNGLSHFKCYALDTESINDIGYYKIIKEKYWFFRDVKK